MPKKGPQGIHLMHIMEAQNPSVKIRRAPQARACANFRVILIIGAGLPSKRPAAPWATYR